LGQDELSRSLAVLSRMLLKEETPDSTLARIAQLAAGLLPQADAASITISDAGGQPRTVSSTEGAAAELDAEQYRLDEGPSLAATRERQTFQIDSMRTETRWPSFCQLAAAAGVESLLAVPLDAGSAEGTINFFARAPYVFTEPDRSVANLFSAHAGVAAANAAAFADLQAERALLTRRLEDALHSRAVIDQAVGILMERERLGPEEAFQMLRSASQKLNVKLRVIAAEIVESAGGPGAPGVAAPPSRSPAPSAETTSDEGSA
jgi:GAF domain-containing protein